MEQYGSRVLKSECFDLPPKVYERVYTPLPKEAEKLLIDLKDKVSSDAKVNPLVTLTRACQISAGFHVTDEGGIQAFDEQPKADAIVEAINRLSKKAQFIIWTQYHKETDILMDRLEKAKIECVRYDGTISKDQLDRNERTFKNGGECRGIVASTQAASKGHNWQNASYAFYHSNSPKLVLRLQSEDRPHRGDTKHSITYIDMCAENTKDDKRLNALRAKKDLANLITGDNVGEWL